MPGASASLLISSAAIAVIHTALGPDHWLPFSLLAKARGWGRAKTMTVTFWAGLGHVASSLTLAILGLSLGHGAARIAGIEAARGRVGPYALVAFGCAYGLWGVRRAIVRREGLVAHEHGGTVHLHRGGHVRHTHPSAPTTFWTLFAIFVLGPCEPLIPLFVLPASKGMWALAGWTALVFSIVTVAAMMGLVVLASAGVARLPWGPLTRWSHALAGGVIAACGLGVLLLGL
ncbi:MAG TPA: hypothetical protein VFB67_02320 [Candidatus Polarisedimenticolaceae bacterium]|nr:hypothetical protein [Candidatus Polarisedimenticolaceae bacterium]